jgi:hypothetical protein
MLLSVTAPEALAAAVEALGDAVPAVLADALAEGVPALLVGVPSGEGVTNIDAMTEGVSAAEALCASLSDGAAETVRVKGAEGAAAPLPEGPPLPDAVAATLAVALPRSEGVTSALALGEREGTPVGRGGALRVGDALCGALPVKA